MKSERSGKTRVVRLSTECHKTQTRVIILTSYNRRKKNNEAVRRAGKCVPRIETARVFKQSINKQTQIILDTGLKTSLFMNNRHK